MFPIKALFYLCNKSNDGNLRLAGEFLKKMEGLISINRRVDGSQYYLLSSWLAVLEGNISEALGKAKKSLDLIVEAGVPAAETLIRLVLVHALHLNSDRAAGKELVAVCAASTRTGSAYTEYLCHLTKAYFALEANDRSTARRTLGLAMKKGRENNFSTISYFWVPGAVSRLCLEAFQAGIEAEYAAALVGRLKLAPPDDAESLSMWPWPVKIYTLGKFEIVKDGKPLGFRGKVQQKPLALLKTLIAFGSRDVSGDSIAYDIWPDSDGAAAHKSFEMALIRLRKLLGERKSVFVSEGKITLDNRVCWVDLWDMEKAIRAAENAWVTRPPNEALTLTARGISLYPAPFLPGEDSYPWLTAARERIAGRILRLLLRGAAHHESRGEWERALAYLEKGLSVDDLSEEIYQRLLVCNGQLGRTAEAMKLYRRCRERLHESLGIKPSPRTEEIARSILHTD